MPTTAEWNAASAMAQAWQARTLNGSGFKALDLSKADYTSLITGSASGIRVYLAYDNGVYKGVALQTSSSGGTHNDVTNNHPQGVTNPFFKILTQGTYVNNTLSNPASGVECSTPTANEANQISWDCATNWARTWQNTLLGGNAIKGIFIPKIDLEAALNEMPNEAGVRIYFGKASSGFKGIIVGQDASGNDLVPASLPPAEGYAYKAYDFTDPCPTQCGERNDFNN